MSDRLVKLLYKNLSFICIALMLFTPASYMFATAGDNVGKLSMSIMLFAGGFFMVYVLKNFDKEWVQKVVKILF